VPTWLAARLAVNYARKLLDVRLVEEIPMLAGRRIKEMKAVMATELRSWLGQSNAPNAPHPS
jgi:hypothetical protein